MAQPSQEETADRVIPGAPFEEPLRSVADASIAGRTIRGLLREQQEAEDTIKSLRQEIARERMGQRRTDLHTVAMFLIRCFGLWALFHLCLWSWSQQAPQSLGQQSYQYLDTAIRKGVLPPLSELVKKDNPQPKP